MDENKVYFGLKNMHYAIRDGADESGKPKWKDPVPFPGAVGLSPKVEGDSQVFYADDIAYYVSESNNGYTGDLEIAKVPDDFLVNALGWEIDSNGMLVEIADGIKQEFALMGQVQGDRKPRKFIYYCCSTARPEKESNSKSDKTEPDTTKLSLTMLPMLINGKLVTKAKIELNDSNQEAYDNFFKQVTLPSFPTSITVTGVSLNKTTDSIVVGSNDTLVATVAPANATNKSVTWHSSNELVATVDNTGKVAGVAAGTATITVTTADGNKTATCAVTVTAS